MAEVAETPIREAVNRVRETAKWLLVTAGAIGAVLFTGVQLSQVGKLNLAGQVVAAIAVFVGIAGAVWAVYGVQKLLMPKYLGLSAYRSLPPDDPAQQFLAINPEMLRGFESLEQLHQERMDALSDWKAAYDAWLAAKNVATATALKAARARAGVTTPLMEELGQWGSYVQLRSQYQQTLRDHVLPGILLAAAAAVLFAFIAAPRDDPAEDPAETPARSLAGLTLDGARLGGVDLTGVDLSGSSLTEATLDEAVLAKARLNGANLSNASLKKTDFTSANLEGANLSGADVSGAVWKGTTCPDGTSSDAAEDTCDAHLVTRGAEASPGG